MNLRQRMGFSRTFLLTTVFKSCKKASASRQLVLFAVAYTTRSLRIKSQCAFFHAARDLCMAKVSTNSLKSSLSKFTLVDLHFLIGNTPNDNLLHSRLGFQ